MSSFARILELSDALESPLDEESQRRQQELIALIEAGPHIVLGARATMFYTRPRYTADVDYAVDQAQFAKIRTWFEQSGLSFGFNGEAIECPAIRVNVIDGSRNAVIEAVLRQAKGIPPLEAVAALKYVAAISPTRAYDRKQQDAADLAALVLKSGFDDAAFLALLVGPYEAERERAGQVLADIKAHRSFQL
ncbi:MAG: hypothetical protein GY778_06550 [bacterium]|nr:hypothetical protein [bacterium]